MDGSLSTQLGKINQDKAHCDGSVQGKAFLEERSTAILIFTGEGHDNPNYFLHDEY